MRFGAFFLQVRRVVTQWDSRHALEHPGENALGPAFGVTHRTHIVTDGLAALVTASDARARSRGLSLRRVEASINPGAGMGEASVIRKLTVRTWMALEIRAPNTDITVVFARGL